jgi:murein endopeptidase
VSVRLLAALLAVVALGAAAGAILAREADERRAGTAPATTPPAPTEPERAPPTAEQPQPEPRVPPRIRWRDSVAVGDYAAGRLVRGVRLPSEGRHFFTWDPVLRRSPNRHWRRWGTDDLIRLVLRIAREHRAANPGAPRLAVGDISRPRGGDFGPQFGYIGHASHQNGLDVDVYYPRADRRERAPRGAAQIDRRLSQDLVDRFLAAGAVKVFVGPSTGLRGPPGRVVPLVNHDNHLHARIAR